MSRTNKSLKVLDGGKFDIDALISALEVGLDETAVKALREGYAQFRREVELAGGVIKLPAAGVTEHIGERLFLVSGITETVRENLRIALVEGIEAIETISQITERITAIINDETRARWIAQTEVTNAFNHSRWLGMKENGFTHKMWLCKRDNLVRTEHRALDGQIRKIDEPFSNGLQYPSEINCRCYIKPHRIR
ncbi:minor capsid protein [bacterium]|nr:minor capsid protein [bacterium]